MIRAIADTGSGIGWVRWLSPLGWFEELRPPGFPSVPALVVIAVAIVALTVACLRC